VDSDRSRRIEDVYRRVLEQEPGRRLDAIERECGGDVELRRAVEVRLAQGHETVGWVPPELRQLGSYTLEARLGAGGMGEVFRAVDTRLGRGVAIKVVKQEFGARFQREARAISALNHRHVCTLYDIGPNFLVMELIDGETLAERIRRGPLPLADVLRYGAEIAEALAAAHAQGIVHRDLKPGNVMIGADGVKVLDFGLAKLTTGPVDAPTETRLAMATPAYMSPEQALGRECDGATDLFALGLVLHEMLVGALPFPGASLGSMLALGEVSIPKPIRSRAPRARKLNALVLRLLEKAPARRPASAADVARTLRAIGGRGAGWRWALPVGAAAGVLVAVAGFWWYRTSGSGPEAPLQVSRVEMVTNYVGDETTPAVSPDGSRVAFAWRGEQGVRLYVTALSGDVDPAQLTHSGNPPAETTADVSPAWSPDGRTIAFVRKRGATNGEIMTIPAGGGSETSLRQIRLIGLGGTSLAWSQNGAELAFSEASRATGRATVFALRVADAQIRQLTAPPDGVSGDASPSFSPDGRSLAFERWLSPGSTTVQVQALDADGAPRGEPVLVDDGRSPAWLDRSRLLFLAGTRILQRSTNGPSRQVYISSDQLLGLAAVRHHGNGPPGVVVAQRSATGPRLWKLPLKGPGQAAGRPELQTRFGNGVTNPDFSPDGRHVVFASSRSGTPEIWMANPDGGDLTQLTTLGLARNGIPRWAPDSRRVAFFARMPDEPQIYVIDWTQREARPRQVTHDVPGCIVPTWSRDGVWVYCSRRVAGEMRLYRVKPTEDGREPQLERLFEGKDARETADGRILYVKDDRPGLFSRSLAGNPLENPEERLVDDIIGPIAYYAPTAAGVYYRSQNSFGRYESLRFFDYARRTAVDVAPRSTTGAMAALTVSPDGTELLYAQQAEPGVDLALIEFR
jgi:eukaryotic-like serine/threonine-protein kinase